MESYELLCKSIPCIKNKCLKYPICKPKKTIACTLVHRYYGCVYNEVDDIYLAWNIMRTALPNLYRISNDNNQLNISRGI